MIAPDGANDISFNVSAPRRTSARNGPSYVARPSHSRHHAIDRAIDSLALSSGGNTTGASSSKVSEMIEVSSPRAAASKVRLRVASHLELDLAAFACDAPKDLVIRNERACLVLLGRNRHHVCEHDTTCAGC